jgi:hypothetical protein
VRGVLGAVGAPVVDGEPPHTGWLPFHDPPLACDGACGNDDVCCTAENPLPLSTESRPDCNTPLM